ncbi:hypothetical protein V6N13_027100 [Hibiscus sabdariffa]|uniref:Thiaminase-2/PQQC domain-containing protein n=1 Tax=Hibiscus sabdariffa TaxID=183260 RepID=A0ABR2A4E0_9ROSI
MRSLLPSPPYPIISLFKLARSHRRLFSSPPPPTRRPSNPMAIPPKSSAAAVFPADDCLAKSLWIKFRREFMLSLYSPFSLCLASGSLKIDTFRHYIAQDVHFLKASAHACELAEDCADDDDAKLAISELRKGVLKELKMHNSFVQEWSSSDCVKESPVNTTTLKCTEFLLATASGKVEGLKAPGALATPFEKTKIAAYTLGAITPCMSLYAFLGTEFRTLLDSNEHDHPYKKWIENYSSESFQASALQTEDLLDKLSAPLTGEELNTIEKLYHQAMKLEVEFFYSQPLTQPTIAPLTKEHDPEQDHLMIFSDFDLTCTIVDSSAILAEIAIVTARKSDRNQPAGQIGRMSSAELRNAWGLLSTQYTEEYEQCIESILPSEKVEFKYETLHKALEQLSDFEKRANSRVIESGVLKGLNREDIKRAGKRLVLQDGCISFFQKIAQNKSLNANIHVLSYCWCGDLIRTAFSAGRKFVEAGGLDALNIHTNEFSFEESVSTGEIVWKVQSPIDKIQAFNDILQDCSNDRKNLSVYVGDSVGDLLCLLKADIGIVIGTSSSLRRVGSEYGVSFVPLFTGLVKKQKDFAGGRSPCIWKGQSGILYTASSWDDIHAFILGL